MRFLHGEWPSYFTTDSVLYNKYVPFDHHPQVLVCLTNLWYIRCTGFDGMEMVQVTPLRELLTPSA